MLLRKLWTLIFIVLLNCFIIPFTCADNSVPSPVVDQNLASVIQQGVQNIITYISGATTIQNQANATMMFMDAPGRTTEAKNVASAAGVVETTLNSNLLPKEIYDINWSLYATPSPGEQISGDPINNFIQNHENYFCSPTSGVEGVLGTPACSSNNLQNEHADLKISSLLIPSVYDQSQMFLAQEVIRTLTLPFPDGNIKAMVSNGLAKSSDKNYVAKMMAEHAIIGVARNSLNEIFVERIAELTPTVPPQATSIMSIMETESGRRFKNQVWYDAVSQSSQEALLRELIHMEAFRLWMDYYRYRQSERMEALLAAMTSQSASQAILYMQTMSIQNK
jgi:hypothetical protein